ncbi:MAG: hypothetical protein RJB55_1516, partial [Verrucomicrobiota bacterium]
MKLRSAVALTAFLLATFLAG